jgi:membrane-associated protease RseP (regulator of RpoE activity)
MSATGFVSTPPELDDLHWLEALLRGVYAVDDITPGALNGRALRVRGRFLIPTNEAYRRLAPACRARGRTLMFRQEEGQPVILVLNGLVRPSPNRRWLPVILAALTILSMLVTFTLLWQMEEPGWAGFVRGLPGGAAFTVSLLAILMCHEFGHFFMARHFGVAVTLPYLIPFPLSPLGTMGAVIQMKDVPPSRRAMLMIGAAGPVAGLIIGIPLLLLGLALSTVQALPTTGGYVMEGNSLLYGLLKFVVFGQWLPSAGQDVMIHPVAFGGWAGLLVTSFNLIPAGQLDGGHVASALLHEKARYLNWVIIGLVLLMGFLWQGWFLWAALILLFSRVRAQPLDDVTPLTWRERWIAVALLALFVLTFTPVPLRIFAGGV